MSPSSRSRRWSPRWSWVALSCSSASSRRSATSGSWPGSVDSGSAREVRRRRGAPTSSAGRRADRRAVAGRRPARRRRAQRRRPVGHDALAGDTRRTRSGSTFRRPDRSLRSKPTSESSAPTRSSRRRSARPSTPCTSLHPRTWPSRSPGSTTGRGASGSLTRRRRRRRPCGPAPRRVEPRQVDADHGARDGRVPVPDRRGGGDRRRPAGAAVPEVDRARPRLVPPVPRADRCRDLSPMAGRHVGRGCCRSGRSRRCTCCSATRSTTPPAVAAVRGILGTVG